MRRTVLLIPSLAVSLFLSSCGGGGTPPPPPITVTVTPASATVSPGGMTQFTANVTGTTNTSVIWQVSGTPGGNSTVGMISATGLYTAPSSIPNPATVTVTAVSSANTADSGSAMVTVAQQVAVSVTPNPINVAIFTTQQFTAAVNGVPSSAVTWQVNGVTGGSQSTGYISTSGLFVAPSGVPTTPNGNGGVTTTPVTVTAVSTANTSSSGSASVTIFPPNQNPQAGPFGSGLPAAIRMTQKQVGAPSLAVAARSDRWLPAGAHNTF